MSWIMALAALPLCALILYHIRESNYEVEEVKIVGGGTVDSDEKSEVKA